jgi:hypothetical protein
MQVGLHDTQHHLAPGVVGGTALCTRLIVGQFLGLGNVALGLGAGRLLGQYVRLCTVPPLGRGRAVELAPAGKEPEPPGR